MVNSHVRCRGDSRRKALQIQFFAYLFTAAWFAMCIGAPAEATTLWTEDAENGAAHIIDNTTGGYSLIQSEVVAQGSFAFHLANPNFQPNSFVINQTLTIQPDTKVFFLSRLRAATPTQIAKVQISTNGGGSYANIYSQSGTGFPGEGVFGLRTVDVSSYANQNVRFRFLYDFTGGSAYTQTTTDVGWLVDDIQVGGQFQKIQFSIGNPSAYEQQYLEYINRSRADALVEAQRLTNETDPSIQSAYASFGINPQNIVNQFTAEVNSGAIPQHAQPLSFQPQLLEAAELHTLDQYTNMFQGHVSSNNPPAPFQPGDTLGNRLSRVGYQGSAGENVYSYAASVANGHAGFDVDWGNVSDPSSLNYNPTFNGQGMQNPPGHRLNLHNASFSEVGIGVINGTNGSVGPQLVTEDFGNSGTSRYVTGVVYQDLNGNHFYDIGEGRSGVRIDVDGSAFFAISAASGGYSVPLSQDGTYTVSFSGGGYSTFSTNATVVGQNVKVDDLVTAISSMGDFNRDSPRDSSWRLRHQSLWRRRAMQSRTRPISTSVTSTAISATTTKPMVKSNAT